MGKNHRSIAIIGGGQAGLQLAIHLLSLGQYQISLFTERTAEQVRQGRIMSSQGMFDAALQIERLLGLNFWDNECPQNTNITFTLAAPHSNERAIYWQGKVKPYQSIDQRIKFSYWLEIFEEMGGTLFIQNVGIQELDSIAQQHDLTIVASGKGEISQAFAIDTTRSQFTTPQRALSCLYVKDMLPAPQAFGVRINVIPGVGEYLTMPGLTHNGRCEMMLFEGIPRGPFDCWDGITTPQEHLEQAKDLLNNFVSWEAERCRNIMLTDDQATLIGCYTPVIRHPVLQLPCGKTVLGLGDTVILNDPIAGQGANHACKAAHLYADSIHQRGDKPFDESWMQETAELSWNQLGKHAVQLSTLLLMPPPPHVMTILQAAATNQLIADRLANGFDDPATISWLSIPEQTQSVLHQIAH